MAKCNETPGRRAGRPSFWSGGDVAGESIVNHERKNGRTGGAKNQDTEPDVNGAVQRKT
jgi:hypothetical protein